MDAESASNKPASGWRERRGQKRRRDLSNEGGEALRQVAQAPSGGGSITSNGFGNKRRSRGSSSVAIRAFIYRYLRCIQLRDFESLSALLCEQCVRGVVWLGRHWCRDNVQSAPPINPLGLYNYVELYGLVDLVNYHRVMLQLLSRTTISVVDVNINRVRKDSLPSSTIQSQSQTQDQLQSHIQSSAHPIGPSSLADGAQDDDDVFQLVAVGRWTAAGALEASLSDVSPGSLGALTVSELRQLVQSNDPFHTVSEFHDLRSFRAEQPPDLGENGGVAEVYPCTDPSHDAARSAPDHEGLSSAAMHSVAIPFRLRGLVICHFDSSDLDFITRIELHYYDQRDPSNESVSDDSSPPS